MKPGANKRAINPWSKALTLFSRLSGLGMTGFNSYLRQHKVEKPIAVKENQITESKIVKTVTHWQNENHSRQHFNYQPGEYHNSHASVDLWFYLSGEA